MDLSWAGWALLSDLRLLVQTSILGDLTFGSCSVSNMTQSPVLLNVFQLMSDTGLINVESEGCRIMLFISQRSLLPSKTCSVYQPIKSCLSVLFCSKCYFVVIMQDLSLTLYNNITQKTFGKLVDQEKRVPNCKDVEWFI